MEDQSGSYNEHSHIGTPVKFRDPYGKERVALVTTVHGDELGKRAINLVYVETDPTKTDQYGRQIARATSVSAKGEFTAPGGFYYELIS